MTSHRINCHTLFDITATDVRSHFKESRIPFHDAAGQPIENLGDWARSRNQQRNWETLNQLISLRVLPENISLPVYDPSDKTWKFQFDVTSIESISLDNDPVGALISDSDQIPMIVGLRESVGIPPILRTRGYDINTWFTLA